MNPAVSRLIAVDDQVSPRKVQVIKEHRSCPLKEIIIGVQKQDPGPPCLFQPPVAGIGNTLFRTQKADCPRMLQFQCSGKEFCSVLRPVFYDQHLIA